MIQLYLIGFRASGKTTLGQLAAKELGWSFLDTDACWEQRHKTTINEFVGIQGVQAFRRGECDILKEIEGYRGTLPRIVAVGGGIVDHPESLEILKNSRFPKVYLQVPEQEILVRLANSPEKQVVLGFSDPEQISKLYRGRMPLFDKIATATLKNQSITTTLSQLCLLLNRWAQQRV